jgi:hypothetical protein
MSGVSKLADASLFSYCQSGLTHGSEATVPPSSNFQIFNSRLHGYFFHNQKMV